MSSEIISSVDIKLMRAGFSIGHNDAKSPFPESFIENVVYAHLDIDRLQEDDRTRPHQLAIGVAERFSNVKYLYELTLGNIQPPKEIWLYSETTSKRVVAKRVLTNCKLRASNSSYSKLSGGERELLIHRLVFNCFLDDVEYPNFNG